MNNMQNDNQNNTQIKRGRGRPKMDKNIPKQNEKKKSHNNFIQQRELILHLPISMKSSTPSNKKSSDSDKNNFTAKNSEDINTALPVSDNISESDKYDSDNLNLQELNFSPSDNYNLQELMEQLNNKDKIIKKMREELSLYKTSSENNDIKENKYYPLDLQFIDNANGNIIPSDKSDLTCWWCTEKFDTVPCFIPEKFNNNKYYVFGCFCSYNCAMSYNLSMGDYKMHDRYSLIKKLYQYLYGENENLIMAPPKEVLNKYGGPLTIEEYRKNFISCNKEYKLLMPPLVPVIPYIEEKFKERTVINKNDTNKYGNKSNNFTIFDTFKISNN